MGWISGYVPTKVVKRVVDADPTLLKFRLRTGRGNPPNPESVIKKYTGGPGLFGMCINSEFNDLSLYSIELFLRDSSVPTLLNELNTVIVTFLRDVRKWPLNEVKRLAIRFTAQRDNRVELICPEEAVSSYTENRVRLLFDPNLSCALLALGFSWGDYTAKTKEWLFNDFYIHDSKCRIGRWPYPEFITEAKHKVTLPPSGVLCNVLFQHDTSTQPRDEITAIDPALSREKQLTALFEKVFLHQAMEEGHVESVSAVGGDNERTELRITLREGLQRASLDLSPNLLRLLGWGEGEENQTATPADGELRFKPSTAAKSVYTRAGPPYDVRVLPNGQLALHVAGPEVSPETETVQLQFTYNDVKPPNYETQVVQAFCSDGLRYCSEPRARFTLPGFGKNFTLDMSTVSLQLSGNMLNEAGLSMKVNEAHEARPTAHLQMLSDVSVRLGALLVQSCNGMRPVPRPSLACALPRRFTQKAPAERLF